MEIEELQKEKNQLEEDKNQYEIEIKQKN